MEPDKFTNILDDPSLTLHFLAYDNSIKALETMKYLLDTGKFDVNQKEEQDQLTPLHIAAHWDNLSMCQLLLHYGADPLAFSADEQCAIDIANGKSREFLKKLCNRRGQKKKQRRIMKFIRHVFQPHKQKSTPKLERPPSAPPSFINRLDGQEPPTDQIFSLISEHEDRLSTTSTRLSTTSTCSEWTFFTATEGRNLSILSQKSGFSGFESARNSIILNKQWLDFDESALGDVVIETTPKVTPTAPPFSPDATPTIPLRNSSLKPRLTLRNASLLDKNITIRSPKTKKDQIRRSSSLEDLYSTPTRLSTTSEEAMDQVESASFKLKLEELKRLELHELKARLLREKVERGPLDATNRYLYETKLARVLVEKEQDEKALIDRFGDINIRSKYSIPLERLIREDPEISKTGQELVDQVNDHYRRAEQQDATYFVYIYIDPTIETSSFSDFLSSIFYIGKGKNARTYFHLVEALKYEVDRNGKESKKCETILEIWSKQRGVVLLSAFSHINSAHAFIVEGAMIAAMDLANLTNKKGGEFKPPVDKFTQKEKQTLGARLLYNAYGVYKHSIRQEITRKMVPFPVTPPTSP
ncbi:unnamed protein product [Bursaphelenchus okinawaensis]|uniref:LEM domain-containing protein n=1 Tax=Bursaphelenchus okinawaensis TaxID=465554 RepID=A0A811JWR2_9BILA|nr:unnamed protein product [Bursaphelenchus okinawaensis]CAG9086434.1 unnamed protein product [Bursaphelenchus okinawaensis]